MFNLAWWQIAVLFAAFLFGKGFLELDVSLDQISPEEYKQLLQELQPGEMIQYAQSHMVVRR